MLAPDELPKAWLELSAFDITFISLADLKDLKAKHPERFQALRDWLATGTTLCVYDVGKDFARLKELEAILGLPALPLAKAEPAPSTAKETTTKPKEKQPDPKAEHRGWTPANPQDYKFELVGYDPNNGQYQYGAQAMMQAGTSSAGGPGNSLKPSSNTPFVSRMPASAT